MSVFRGCMRVTSRKGVPAMAERVTWIVDRIEGDRAVIEVAAGQTIDLPIAWLPTGVREGSHLRVSQEASAEPRS